MGIATFSRHCSIPGVGVKHVHRMCAGCARTTFASVAGDTINSITYATMVRVSMTHAM
jgi:hypothetical protein